MELNNLEKTIKTFNSRSIFLKNELLFSISEIDSYLNRIEGELKVEIEILFNILNITPKLYFKKDYLKSQYQENFKKVEIKIEKKMKEKQKITNQSFKKIEKKIIELRNSYEKSYDLCKKEYESNIEKVENIKKQLKSKEKFIKDYLDFINKNNDFMRREKELASNLYREEYTTLKIKKKYDFLVELYRNL